MIEYLKIYLLTTGFFIIYVINYVLLRESDQFLYLGNFFSYNFDTENIVIAYFSSIPFISFILYRSFRQLFAMFLSLLMILGVIPGVIIYALSNDESIFVFYIFYIYLVFIFTFFSRNKISLSLKYKNMQNCTHHNINLQILKIFGMIGFFFYLYLNIKYFNLLSLKNFDDVYSQRSLFSSFSSSWEEYFITFSKYISVFSFLIIAISLKRIFYLFFISYIYIIDYLLAAHKASLVLLVFVVIYYSILNKLDLKRYYFLSFFIVLIIFSILLQFSIYYHMAWSEILVGLYDRVFHVTSGLFSRFYDFTNIKYFFYGGSGILGKIFSGVDEPYMLIVGEYYFSKDVRANADLIADGYLNFGVLGSFMQLLILWIIFNKYDNYIFKNNLNLFMPLVFVYSFLLFSMGLQTTLITGGMIFFIFLIKFSLKGGVKNNE